VMSLKKKLQFNLQREKRKLVLQNKKNPKKESSRKKTTTATTTSETTTSTKGKRKSEEMDEFDEDDHNPDEQDKERLRKASAELLTDSEMKAKTDKDLNKRYKRSKTFVKWYEKEFIKSKIVLPQWEIANKKMTDAAATYVKYIGLQKADISAESQLNKAIPKLRKIGEDGFLEALDIVSKLNEEDAKKFWVAQERNKDAKCFEDLITKKEFERRRFQELGRASAIAEMQNVERTINIEEMPIDEE